MAIWRGLPRLFKLLVFAVVAAILALRFLPETVRFALEQLGKYPGIAAKFIPPTLPDVAKTDAHWLDQNWRGRDRYWFHHATQGTATFPMPYDWFVVMEQPGLSLFGKDKFADETYLSRFGFIPSPRAYENKPDFGKNYGYKADPNTAASNIADRIPAGEYPDNPDGLPVGFARLKIGGNRPDRLGFTCAACHTGHLEYKNVSLRFDGGPAAINLGEYEKAVALSLFYTKYIPGRFTRFAEELAKKDPARWSDKDKLKRELDNIVATLRAHRAWQADILENRTQKDTVEGFARLDALNRIGNQVFFDAMIPPKDTAKPNAPEPQLPPELTVNFAPADAPVSFPPVWGVSWFLWAQYDASVFNELVRNAGEALGVKAIVDLAPKHGITVNPQKKPEHFRSSVHMRNISWIEELLRGGDLFEPAAGQDNPGFKGLHAPRWRDAAKHFADDPKWTIDEKQVATGRALYQKYCIECHHGPVRDREFDRQWPNDSFWNMNPSDKPKHWIKIGEHHYLDNVQKPVADMGTDAQQARVLTERQVHLPSELGVNPIEYLNKERNCGIPADEALNRSFVLALMAVVDKTIEQWFTDNPTDALAKKRMWGERPNCPNPRVYRAVTQPDGKTHVAVVPHYRARPLDGVWATAPYLHNGSVPTLYDLLSPQDERPKSFCVGARQFDPVKAGLAAETRCEGVFGPETGLFRFDTSKLGNSNRGHSFEAPKGASMSSYKAGVIGPKFDDDEKRALVAYLKTL